MSATKIATHLSDNLKQEKIIVQGAVDVCFEEDDGLVILDFKTDRVENAESLAYTYGEQLNIYAAACEKIYGKPVKQKIIYSFFKNQEIIL
jgi:ATP-dependent helicase/nuclease subunit A